MPRLTITASKTTLPGRLARKCLILRPDADLIMGFEDDLTATGTTRGVPLKADEVLCLAGKDIDLSAPIYFITASGSANLDYTEKL